MSHSTERWSSADVASAGFSLSGFSSLPPTQANPTPLQPRSGIAPVEFPGYEIWGELGRGGMGVVYKARQQSLNRFVALKVILGGPLASAEDKARFRIEAEAAARLHHPNIVQVYDVGEHAGFSYMALELIEGQTLRNWQNGQRLEPLLAARIVALIARAIQHAHEHGIIHRDIKPANILLEPISLKADDSRGARVLPRWNAHGGMHSQPSNSLVLPLTFTPKVTDFGLAKSLESGTDLTVTGVAYGTPNYMAPEQVRGKAVGVGVDIYALGAVLYELLTGQPPFVGTSPNDVLNQILRSDPLAVCKLAPRVPRDLAVIVGKCLEKEPKQRYLAARELAEDLDRFVAGQPIAARPISQTERVWRWARRNPLVTTHLALTTVGFVITAVLAGAWANSASEERRLRTLAVAAREDADQQRIAAEAARDNLKEALQSAQLAQQLAEVERAIAAAAKLAAEQAREQADQEAADARMQKQQAEAARAIAEDHLRIARGAIRLSLRELSRHPRFQDDDFRSARDTLIQQVRAFRDAVIQHAPNIPEWLDDIADVSHWLGFLEYLNANYEVAAREYRAAAAATARWAELEPKIPLPRSRQVDSLINSGNASIHASQMAEAEKAYREALRVADALVTDYPQQIVYRHQAIEVVGQLAYLCSQTKKNADWETMAQEQLVRAQDAIKVFGETRDNLRWLAIAQNNTAWALTRQGMWQKANQHISQAIATREKIVALFPEDVKAAFEYANELVAYGRFLNPRDPQEAEIQILKAIAIFEKQHKMQGEKTLAVIEVANGYTQIGEFCRAQGRFSDAEKWFEKALGLVATVLERVPNYRPAREAWAQATTGRAHLYNHTNRHLKAVQDWAKLATDDPNIRLRPRHELFVIQSLLFAKDWKTAYQAAEAQMIKKQPSWMWLDIARVWCMIAEQIETDSELPTEDRQQKSDNALQQALVSLEKARRMGLFEEAQYREWYHRQSEFDKIRDRFNPLQK